MTCLLLIEEDDETVEAVAGCFRSRSYDVPRPATGPGGLTILETLRHTGVRTPRARARAAADGAALLGG